MTLRFFSYRISRELEKYDYTILNDVFTFYYHGKLYTLDVGSSYPFRAPELIMSNDNIISYNPRLYPFIEYTISTIKTTISIHPKTIFTVEFLRLHNRVRLLLV